MTTIQKYLITFDMDMEADYEGIRKINVVDWLLNQDKYKQTVNS